MKNENVKKINALGKASRIVINVLRVVLVIVMVAVAVAGTLTAFIPDDAISINANANAELVIDESEVSKLLKFDVDQTDFKGKVFGVSYKWIIKDGETEDGDRDITFDGEVKELSGNEVKAIAITAMACLEIVLAILIVVLAFGKKLAYAFEKCESPFEEGVITAMRKFVISLIPFTIFMLIIGSVSGIVTLLGVLVIFLFSAVFKYGAQLQTESEGTV